VEAAFAWIGQLAEWFGQFVPRWTIVKTTEGAVKFVKGAKVVALAPGIHWYWPTTTELERHPIVRQTVDLRAQSFVTTDDKVVVAGGLIVYEVTDVLTLVTTLYDTDETVRDIALSAIHDVCCRMSWEELKVEQRKGTLDTKMKNAAKSTLKDFGINVLKVALTDLAPCRVIKLVQDIDENRRGGLLHQL
jgi:regulator of protease activity HflC (stomatin/prohibitin superfamily)